MKKIPAGMLGQLASSLFSTVVETEDGHLHLSGIVPLLGEDKKPLSHNISTQTEQVLDKIGEILESCKKTWEDVIKVDILIETDGKNFWERYDLVNEVYGILMKTLKVPPARKAYGVVALPFHAMVEIQVETE